jgi:hypothetical protein
MALAQTSFWSLIHKYGVRIPIIQRDYAQGRVDTTTIVIRNKFVHSLYQTLLTNDPNKPLDLDFVYGEVKYPDEAKLRYLIPLDGQQRLTTLYLLHWYLAVAEGRLDEVGPVLHKFTYQTRSSSREFCACLAKCDATALVLGTSRTLSQQLRDAVWFQPAWQRDPTVRAMLTMLDALAEKFGQTTGLFDRLTNVEAPLVGFQFLELDKVGLTDDLYLKMNARGKALTEFENWKAEFDQFLHRHHPERQAEFAHKVDGVWTDLFWHHQQGAPALMDVAFKRFLDYVTTMLGQWRGAKTPQLETEDATADPFARYRQVYSDPDNVHFLFTALDLLSQAEVRDTHTFFSGLFASSQTTNRVVLFEGEINLFSRIINDTNADIRARVLLFAVLFYGVTVGQLDSSDSNLHDLVRVLRNQMERIRQLKGIRYSLILREDDIAAYLADIAALVAVPGSKNPLMVYELLASNLLPRLRNSSRYTHEEEKARLIVGDPTVKKAIHQLEDLPVFRGALQNVQLDTHQDQMKEMADAAKAIWASGLKQEQIIQAWLTLGDYSLPTGRSLLGDKHFFGNTDNWYTILTTGEKNLLAPFLLAYLDAPGSTSADRLQEIVDTWLAEASERNWQYYFVKYPQMTQESTGQYVWDAEYHVRLLSRSSLRAFHINPYVRTVVRLVNDPSKCPEYSAGTTDAYESPLQCFGVLKARGRPKTVNLYCQEEGWFVELPKGCALADELAEQYHLDPKQPGFLTETATKDRIEITVAFVNHLYKYGLVAAK